MKRFVRRMTSSLPKRLTVLFISLLAVVLPISTLAQSQIAIEGSIGVYNQSRTNDRDANHTESADASYNEDLHFQVYYHNRESAESDLVAENFKVNIDLPTEAGNTQVVRVTMGGDDTNTVTDTAVVNLDRDDAMLEYVPGTAEWHHNIGDRDPQNRVTEKIADSKILGEGAVITENLKPCYEYEGFITFVMKVRVPSVGIYKAVREADKNVPAEESLSVSPGERLQYVVQAKNLGNEDLTNVYLRDPLPEGLTYVPGTAKKYYGEYNGTVMSESEANAFFNGRKNIGTILPGNPEGYVPPTITFEATVPSADELECGVNTIKNIAVVDTDQTGEYHDTATVRVVRECAEVPTYSCDLLDVDISAGRKVTITKFETTATNGAEFKDTIINWGDGSDELVTNTPVDQTHTYEENGEYTIVATARFDVDGEVVVATDAKCKKKVKFVSEEKPEAPTELPDTGAGEVAGLFAVVTAAGTVAHKFVYSRRFNG